MSGTAFQPLTFPQFEGRFGIGRRYYQAVTVAVIEYKKREGRAVTDAGTANPRAAERIEPLTVWNRLNGSNGCLFYRTAAEVL